ncbi:MAG: GGDEF domain-containing protein [Pseudomonadota bacterium]
MPRSKPSIRTLQTLLVLACVLPASLAVGIALVHAYQVERAALVERALGSARALSRRIDLQLSVAAAGLQALATSPSLHAGDLRSFEAQARRALRYQGADTLVLKDAQGSHMIDIAAGTQASNIAAPRSRWPGAMSIDDAVVSDLFVCDVLRRPLVTVGVPLRHGDDAAYFLTIGLFPERLQQLLRIRPVPPDWVVSLFDSKGTIIARTHDAQAWVGKLAVPPLQRAMLAQREGTVQTTLRDGRVVLAAFSRAGEADWPVMIGIPEQELTWRLQRSLALLTVATLLLLAAGLALARRLAARIDGSIQGLVAPAMALGRGEPVAVPALQLREAEQVARAMQQASGLIAARTAERDLVAEAHRRAHVRAERLAHAATHDALTGLRNRAEFRRLLQQHLDSCACNGESIVVLFADVDDFKGVNDAHGHGVGDALLREFAQRLLASVRDTDIVGRLGGDEFGVILVRAPGARTEALAHELTERLSRPYAVGEVQVHVSASIGVAPCGGPGTTADALIEAADAAMYQAKAGGKRQFAFSGFMPG